MDDKERAEIEALVLTNPQERALRQMSEIAEPIIQHYHTDLLRDREFMHRHPKIQDWLWIPYDMGTHMAPLKPHGKDWARAIIEHSEKDHPGSQVYLVNALDGRVRPIARDRAQVLIRGVPEPIYTVYGDRHYRGEVFPDTQLIQTGSWPEAQAAFNQHQWSAYVVENYAEEVLLRKVSTLVIR